MAHYMQDFTERMRIIKGCLVRPAGSDPRALGHHIVTQDALMSCA